MASPWLGFLPGLFFGLGATIALVLIGGLLGTSLRLARSFTEQEIKRIGALTGGRTLLFGGLLYKVHEGHIDLCWDPTRSAWAYRHRRPESPLCYATFPPARCSGV